MSSTYMLDAPLLQLAEHDYWRVGDALRHTFISGDSGSGKSSGSGATIRHAMLHCSIAAGGLVLAGKSEEAAIWRAACKKTGRSHSVIVVNGRNAHAFNWLQYEMARLGTDGINSVIEGIMRVVEAARVASGDGGKQGEHFWLDSAKVLLRHALPVIHAATGTLTIPTIIEFVRTAPRTPDEMRDPEWQARAPFFKMLMASEQKLASDVGDRIISYWLNEYCVLDPKTRTNMVATLTATLDRFNHGWLRKMFCGKTTFVPEMCFHGQIIILDLPALTLNEDGIIAQILFKFIWQRAMLSRNALPAAQRERLVFLWIDEYQLFASSYDPTFLSTCRASNVACVLLTQSLPTLIATMGGEDARAKVDALLSLTATKVIHSTSCVTTAKWAADMIGRSTQRRANYSAGDNYSESEGTNVGMGDNWGGNDGVQWSSGTSTQRGGGTSGPSFGTNGSVGGNRGSSWGGNSSVGRNRGTSKGVSQNAGWSEQLDYSVEPADLGRRLRTGGRANRYVVDGIWYQSGRVFAATGSNYLMASFKQ